MVKLPFNIKLILGMLKLLGFGIILGAAASVIYELIIQTGMAGFLVVSGMIWIVISSPIFKKIAKKSSDRLQHFLSTKALLRKK